MQFNSDPDVTCITANLKSSDLPGILFGLIFGE